MEFARWLDAHGKAIADRWLTEVRARSRTWDPEAEPVVARFFQLLVDLLPITLSPYRKEAEELWMRASEMFGAVSARRGLAAGEVIEEFQLLRECMLRLILDDSRAESIPMDGAFSRDLLRLNRVIDSGVSRANLGHTDILFFTLVRGSGVPGGMEADFIGEVYDQLDGVREELSELDVRVRV